MKPDGTPVLAFYSRALDCAPWMAEFARVAPEIEVRLHPDLGELSEIDVLCAFRPPKGLVASLPNLKFFQVLGAGTDHLKPDEKPPVAMARLVDASTKNLMADYVLGAVLRHHRRFDFYERLKHERVWQRTEPLRTGDRLIGVLGYGALGRPVAQRLRDNGFVVRVWRNSHAPADGLEVFAGEGQLGAFFTGLDAVVGLLPLMPETIGIINEERLSLMKKGAFLVNVGRGQHLDEEGLRPLLDSGQISGATLDVVSVEPLPDDHWFWTHPSVLVTPHVATLPRADTAVPFIAQNVARVLRGEKPELAVEH